MPAQVALDEPCRLNLRAPGFDAVSDQDVDDQGLLLCGRYAHGRSTALAGLTLPA
jgi:hypothetical protein